MMRIDWVEVWLLICAWAVSTGWILSWLGFLNKAGYICAALLGAVLFRFLFTRERSKEKSHTPFYRRKRFRKPLPFLFLIVSILAFVGGALNAPNNYDGLTYRFPRILHWIAEGRWHWIETANDRMNICPAGFEWLTVPLFLFTSSDRFFFLINWITYLLLPGAIFCLFRQLGISSRVTWHWMWLLPLGYCYVLQAGSIGNDSFATLFALTAISYALRARKSGSLHDMWLSILSISLLTGVKASNLPLVLPWFIAVLPCVSLFRKNILQSGLVACLGLLISFFPTALLNVKETGSWSGDPSDHHRVVAGTPLIGWSGNAIELIIQNLWPPVFPKAGSFGPVVTSLIPESVRSLLESGFPRFDLQLRELSQEESSGLGFGIFLLLLASLFAIVYKRLGMKEAEKGRYDIVRLLILLSSWIALIVLTSKLAVEIPARLITPYYPLLAASVLCLPTNGCLVQKKWWKFLSMVLGMTSLLTVILTPSRPLLPVPKILDRVWGSSNASQQIERARTVYEVYHSRNDSLSSLRKHIPSEVKIIGFIAGGDQSEVSLWRPFGERKVKAIPSGKIGTQEKSLKIEYVVMSSQGLEMAGFKIEDWLLQNSATLVAQENITTKASVGPEIWYVARVK